MGCRALQGTIAAVQKQSMVFTAEWRAAACIASSEVQALATKYGIKQAGSESDYSPSLIV